MEPLTTSVFTLLFGLMTWSVQFNETTQHLTLKDSSAGVTISGTLSFQTPVASDGITPAEPCGWRIVNPRDAVPSRLAIIDRNNDVQGYIVFNVQGERLEMLCYHRTRQFYTGLLTFKGCVELVKGPSDQESLCWTDHFACRTKAATSDRVLTLSAGRSDSSLNDSIFDRQADSLLQFNAANVCLSTNNITEEEASKGSYSLDMSGRMDQASESTFVFNLERNYFQKRYVPYYKPIDRNRCPSAPTGWMSWNVYFDKAGSKENLDEARVGQKYLQPFGMEFWSIESWQGNSDQLPVSDFYNLNLESNEKQFPEGMKWLADEIRKLGFRPGLWTAPFGTGSDEFYQAHKSWFLHGEDGKPLRTWNGRYTIDPSQDEVIEHIRKIHDIASHEWGYEYFKIDGMSGSSGGYCAHFFERPYVRKAFKNPDCPNPFERVVKALRAGIGEDRVFLACQGHFTGAEAEYADAARIGSDIVHPNQPVKWGNIMNQAGRTINQIFTHNIVSWADPDTLLVNSEALDIEQARVSTVIVSLPGQMMFAGDKLAELKPERMRLLQQTLPVCDVRPLNLYPYFNNPPLPVWDLKVIRNWGNSGDGIISDGIYDVVALFNWSEEESQIGFRFEELGLPGGDQEYALWEFWTQQYQGTAREQFSMTVPPRSVRLLAVHKKLNRIQFLSSDRHVTQGAIDITSIQYNEQTDTISGTVNVVANNPVTLTFLNRAGEIQQETVSSKQTGEQKFSINDQSSEIQANKKETSVQ